MSKVNKKKHNKMYAIKQMQDIPTESFALSNGIVQCFFKPQVTDLELSKLAIILVTLNLLLSCSCF